MRRTPCARALLASAALFVGLAAARTSAAASDLPASARWKPNVNYTVISPAQPTNAPPGKVQVMEFFYLACPFCHALEPYLEAWRKSKPAYVQFVRVPVMWAPLQVKDARLFYTLEALGRDDLVETAFQTLHRLEQAAGGDEDVMVGDTPAKTFAVQAAFAERHGVAASAFASAYNSFDVHVELDRARELGQTFEITHTPTIIVDGRYRTDVAKAGGNQQLIALITFLTAWDHAHPGTG
jgi:thiol:disulfide interchange protein DsbA